MDPNNQKKFALLKITSHLIQGARKFLEKNNFLDVSIHANSLTNISGACENVSTLFPLEYFGKKAFLSQSNQLQIETWTPYVETGKVYCLVRSFRAEPIIDNRHLTEFSLLELEHLGDLSSLILNIKGVVRYACESIAENCEKELALFGVTSEEVADCKFSEISYTQAVDYLQKNGYSMLQWGDDLTAGHEARLVEEFGHFLFVKRYPKPIKFFNMLDTPRVLPEGQTVESCDLLAPYSGEMTGAAAREHDIFKICGKLLDHNMYRLLKEQGVQDTDFDKYLNAHLLKPVSNVLQTYRDTPEFLEPKQVPLHSGCGIGIQRFIQSILKLNDIREACVDVRNAGNLN